MRTEDFLAALKQQPFQPFRVHLSNGQVFDIRHPEMAKVGRSTVMVFTPMDQLEDAFERYDTLALVHVNRIEPLTTASR